MKAFKDTTCPATGQPCVMGCFDHVENAAVTRRFFADGGEALDELERQRANGRRGYLVSRRKGCTECRTRPDNIEAVRAILAGAAA